MPETFRGSCHAKTRPAHRVTSKVTSRPRSCLGSCGSLIVSCSDGSNKSRVSSVMDGLLYSVLCHIDAKGSLQGLLMFVAAI